MRTHFISDLQRFETFRNCSLFCTFWLLRNFYCCDAHHANYGKHSLNNHFQHCRDCIGDLQCFQTFRNCCLFCAFWLIRNIYSGDAHDANYCKHSLNHHFQYWTQCISDLQCFQTFRNCSFFCTSWLLRNFYCCDAHHANYGKHSLNHHFQHCAHSVYQIYSVLKLFEIADSFTHFGFYEISTLVMRIMLPMGNIVQIITFNIAYTVYIRFLAFWKFSKLQFVLHILAFKKILLWWCASCYLWQT